MPLQDISTRFMFREWTVGPYSYKEASGELGVPGEVVTHRSISAQVGISHGSGEHAGHLIGVQFGAPGDIRNLGLQNPNINTFSPKSLQTAFQGSGGSYHNLESRWANLLRQRYRISVRVVDKYRRDEKRPFSRSVQWTEITPNAANGPMQSLEFGNFSSPQGRV